jgi:DNA-binding NarL/FixJ family response regulator
MTEPATSRIGVVIVDDHRMFAEGLGRLLAEEVDIEMLGIASRSVDAIDLARRLQPQVMLVDYQMPELNGISLAPEIRLVSPDTSIVMVTGAAEDRVLLAAIEAGYSGFITKDRASAEVVDAVRAAAVGEAVISPMLLMRLLPRLNRHQHVLGADLTEREHQVLSRLGLGLTSQDIAADLHLSINTIRNYVQSVLTKLDAHSKLQAVATAVREGIIEYPARS